MTKTYKKFKKLIEKNESSWINLAILSIIALFVKQYCTHLTYKNLLVSWFNYYVNSFCTDLIVILIILCLTTLNHFIKNRSIRILNNIISFIIFIIFCIDIFTIYFLQNRVSILEAFQYINNGWNWFTNIVLVIIIMIIIVWTILLLLTTKIKKNSKITKNILLSILLILLWISTLFSTPKKIQNILTINIEYIKDKIFTEKFYTASENDILEENDYNKIEKYQDYIKNVNWEWKDINIILVFAESLSAIDSANIWWKNSMPWFDEIQNNWIKFTNFVTNGKTSDTAHIATLYWVIPLINIWTENTPYKWYELLMEPLPSFLNKQWYQTTFISAASLNFLDQREFLSWAWFQKIIWEEEFENKKKYTFDAAPDEDLYKKVLEEIKIQTWKYFIWLQTISFHTPYYTPYWKTEEQALKYSDEKLYEFYKELEQIWYFDNWILVIIWDHRKMTPAENKESEIFWENWYTKSVATIVWTWINAWTINTELIQHTDFYNSLKRLVWKWGIEIDKTYNDVFSQEINRKRGITSARYFLNNNKYTVSILWWKWFIFNNLSSFNKSQEPELYNYLSKYINYEFWNDNENKKWNETILIWHQWARNDAPENSLESFITAKKQWAKWVELDVSYTKDKKNIVAHWEYFYASNCSNLKIQNYDYNRIAENCTLKNWETYKTLKEMLTLIDWVFDYYFIEIKVQNEKLWIEQTLDAINTVRKLNMQNRVIFISYSDTARRVLNLSPDIIFWWDTYEISDVDIIWENNSKYFLAPYDLLTEETIKRAQDLWKKVVTYTINNTWDFQKMKDLWVNIILTDNIPLLKEYENNN